MKAKQGFELRDICEEKVLIAKGIENLDFNQLISLNETAAFLWNKIAETESFTEQQLADALLNEYDVDEKTAAEDVHKIVQTWLSQGVVTA